MKTLAKDSHRSSLAALLSLLFHLSLLPLALSPQKAPLSLPLPLEVERITPEQLKKYRNVGVKKGSRLFSVPIPRPSPPGLQSLRSQQEGPPLPPSSRRAKPSLPPLSSQPPYLKRKLRVENLRPSDTTFLRQTDFNVEFDPPKVSVKTNSTMRKKPFGASKRGSIRPMPPQS